MSLTDRVLLPSGVKPMVYNLELTPDLSSFTFKGSLSIDIIVSEAGLRTITMHAKTLTVESAVFFASGEDIQGTASVSIEYDDKLSRVIFTFQDDLPIVSSGRLQLVFTGILNDAMCGFYRSKYTDADGNVQFMASTQFEALDARRAFPCWDEPAVKAVFNVSMIIPEELTAVSNMPEKSIKILPGGLKRVVFDRTPIMSTYLVAFAVGRFDSIQGFTKNGVSMRVFTQPGKVDQVKFALDVGLRCLQFLDEYFQIPYPLPKCDMMSVTEFAAGAMENWGLVTYREAAILLNESTAEVKMKQRVAMVICHELAHQWFGNLVTMNWWCDLWLNEGFANWMQHFCTNALFPEWRIWESYSIDSVGAALRLDALRSSHPIQVPIVHAEEVEEVFDGISYNKGSSVIHMISKVLGPENFRSGLQLYFKRHKYGNTETTDLWAAWSEASGTDVEKLMSSWTSKMGFPCITVKKETWATTELDVDLEQRWFVSDGSGQIEEQLWNIPLINSTKDTGKFSPFFATTREFSLKIPLIEPSAWVKLNAEESALVRVSHSEEMITRLIPAISSKSISAIDRAYLLDDQYALAVAGIAPLERIAKLLPAYGNEDNNAVWKSLQTVFSGMKQGMESVSAGANAAFDEFCKKIVMKALATIGWEPMPGEDDTKKEVRAIVISLAASFCATEASVVEKARELFNSYMISKDARILPSDFRGAVYRIVLIAGGQTEFDTIMQEYNAATDDETRRWALSTLGFAPSLDLKLRVMEWSISGDVKLQDCYSPMLSVNSSGALGAETAWSFLKNNFSRIVEFAGAGNAWTLQGVIVCCTGSFSSLQKADEIESFFAANPVPNASRKISQAVEKIRVNAGFVEKISASQLSNPQFWA